MTTQTEPPLGSFADWIRATDEHASARLETLAEAERLLTEAPEASVERQTLATKLERWRYRHLNARCGRLAPEDLGLVAALDLAANELAGRAARPPRWPRSAVEETTHDSRRIALAEMCLDPQTSIDEIAHQAAETSGEHFAPLAADGATGRRMLMYAPLYLSSHCVNHCSYCGFRHPVGIPRKHLSPAEAFEQARLLLGRGIRHILLVAGEFPSLTSTEYLLEIVDGLTELGVSPAIEIAPQDTASYAALSAAGVCGITLYQETYNEQLYALYHPQGPKRWFDWRLEGLDRAAEAGIGRLGLGVLLGLADPREELMAMIGHADYLHARFPDRTLAFSLPRIYEAPSSFQTPYPVDDETFIRMYCALRAAFPEAELVLSTREPVAIRNRLARICITQLSAGSSTVPGGYEGEESDCSTGAQFPISDHRTVSEVTAWLRENGIRPTWDV